MKYLLIVIVSLYIACRLSIAAVTVAIEDMQESQHTHLVNLEE